jgi:hypothetical protein
MPRRYVLLLVAGTLVLLGAGLLLPAVSRVREAAARMACHSNFKGLACALYSYSETNPHGRGERRLAAFPAGTVPNADLTPEQRLSWWVSLLPYMEQQSLFGKFDQSRGAGDPRNATAADHRLRQLVCPSSGEYARDAAGESWKSPTPVTHYVGVAGVGPDAAALPVGHPRAGVFGYDRRTALPDDIPDGTSNTLLLIETADAPGHWAYGGTATVRPVEPGTAPHIGAGRPFGGFHGEGPFGTPSCVVAFADGSVRSLPHTIAPTVLEALATAAGKEPIPVEW